MVRRRGRPGPRHATAATLALCTALAGAARAGDNDLQLWRLGHPDPLNCVKCDGTDTGTSEPGVAAAQKRFARMTAALGLAFVPGLVEPAGTTGQAGFEIGFSGTAAFLSLDAAEWASAGSQAAVPAPPLLAVSTLAVRKGFGGSFEIGAHASWLAASQILAVGLQLRWALIDGLDYAPDLAFRAWGTRLLGTAELDLTGTGADVLLSKSFGLGGVVKLQPYGQFGMVLLHATTGVIDFKPGVEDTKNPGADDGVFHTVNLIENRYQRGAVGLRLLAGAAVIGLEGTVAWGTNPVQQDQVGGAAPPTQTTRQYGASARLGIAF